MNSLGGQSVYTHRTGLLRDLADRFGPVHEESSFENAFRHCTCNAGTISLQSANPHTRKVNVQILHSFLAGYSNDGPGLDRHGTRQRASGWEHAHIFLSVAAEAVGADRATRHVRNSTARAPAFSHQDGSRYRY